MAKEQYTLHLVRAVDGCMNDPQGTLWRSLVGFASDRPNLRVIEGGAKSESKPRNKQRRGAQLPDNLPPRGLTLEQAARYVGIEATFYKQLEKERILPGPSWRFGKRVLYDLRKLDAAMDAAVIDCDAKEDDVWGEPQL